MIFAGIYKNELSVINVFPSIQCFCLNISEMNRIESTSYSVLITRGISRYVHTWYPDSIMDKLNFNVMQKLIEIEYTQCIFRKHEYQYPF